MCNVFSDVFEVSEWTHTVLEILELNEQSYVSKDIISMHLLSDVLCFFKHR